MTEINIFFGTVEDFSQNRNLPDYATASLQKLKNKRSADEKRAGYGLLDYALKQLNINADITKCFLSEKGKPSHKNFYFSISHSAGVVAVAVSSKPLGIDIELSENEIRTDKLKKKIMHENESDGNTLILWTMKEAIFKFTGKYQTFIPSSIDTTNFNTNTFKFTLESKKFILSVASDDLSKIKTHNTQITKIY